MTVEERERNGMDGQNETALELVGLMMNVERNERLGMSE
jgi:hypothetical protein